MSDRRQAYHSHTRRGSRPNASAVASVSGRKFFHSPSGPRNVGTPLAAETPAPVSTVMRAEGINRGIRDFTDFGLRISDGRSIADLTSNHCLVPSAAFLWLFMN